jgi:hypothetical protein
VLNFQINLTSLAIVLWSGMLVIAGSIWVLSSQVRKVADLIEEHSHREREESATVAVRTPTVLRVPRAVGRRGSSPTSVRAGSARSRFPAA